MTEITREWIETIVDTIHPPMTPATKRMMSKAEGEELKVDVVLKKGRNVSSSDPHVSTFVMLQLCDRYNSR